MQNAEKLENKNPLSIAYVNEEMVGLKKLEEDVVPTPSPAALEKPAVPLLQNKKELTRQIRALEYQIGSMQHYGITKEALLKHHTGLTPEERLVQHKKALEAVTANNQPRKKFLSKIATFLSF